MTKRKSEANKDVGHSSDDLEGGTENGTGSGNDRMVQIEENLAEEIEDFIRENPDLGFESVEEFLRDAVRREIKRVELLEDTKTTIPLDDKRVLLKLPKPHDIPIRYFNDKIIVVGKCRTQAIMDRCSEKVDEYATGEGEMGKWEIRERTGKRRSKMDKLVLKAVVGDENPKVEPYVLFLNPAAMIWKTLDALEFFEGVGFDELNFYAIEKNGRKRNNYWP